MRSAPCAHGSVVGMKFRPLLFAVLFAAAACSTSDRPIDLAPPVAGTPPPGTSAERFGDEIMVCGKLIHTGAPVVLWTDPGGYDAYRVTRRFTPNETRPSSPEKGADTPNRYGVRPMDALDAAEKKAVADRGWDIPELAKVVRAFVMHYDVCGTSRQCFKILQDVRGLSVHFMLDLDGTIYQTLDLKERARHSGPGNDYTVGIEIAHIGAYAPDNPKEAKVLDDWYRKDDSGRMRVVVPKWLGGDMSQRTPNFVARPSREDAVVGTVHGRRLKQYDFTEAQYRSLARLTAALCTVFPEMKPEVPRNADGSVRSDALTPTELAAWGGLVAHWHLTSSKIDPGPAFDWDRLLTAVRALMARGPRS